MTRMCEAVRKYGDEREAIASAKTRYQERICTIKEALNMNLPIESIAKLVRLSVEEVQKFIDEMEK